MNRMFMKLLVANTICISMGFNSNAMSQECYVEITQDCSIFGATPPCSGSTCVTWYRVNGAWTMVPNYSAPTKIDCMDEDERVTTEAVDIPYATVAEPNQPGFAKIVVVGEVACLVKYDCKCLRNEVGSECATNENEETTISSIWQSETEGDGCEGPPF